MKKNKIRDLLDLFWTFFKIGLFSFGGGYGMVSLIHNTVITKKKWIDEEEMLDILAIAESTPGPIAINSATFVGFKICGILGGICATLGVALPSLIVISIIAHFYEAFKDIKIIQDAFRGIIVAVAILIIFSALKFFKSLKKSSHMIVSILLLVASFCVSLFTSFSSILLILIGGVIGLLVYTLILKAKEGESE